MDYFGETFENLVTLSQMLKKVVIIDHHLTFEKIMEDISNPSYQLHNIEYFYDKKESGCSLALKYFESIL